MNVFQSYTRTLLRIQPQLYTNDCDISVKWVFMWNVLFLEDFNQNQDVPTDFSKNPKSEILWNSFVWVSWCFTQTPDGRTDGYNEANGRL